VSAVDNAVICDVIAEISAGIEMDGRFNALFSKGGSEKKPKIFFFRIYRLYLSFNKEDNSLIQNWMNNKCLDI
jgi:hypothetical protein